ncbi:MarR family transcriptional regulator [Pigmentiphaga soli]|uniref:MarR family transcriptional regulator n=1 Tax=Pigmentiphaga soli TaxID=1007095 RepID=A0ABP8GTX8_9BURK
MPSPATPSRRAGARLTHDDFAALASLRYELRRFTAFSETAAAEGGLTPQQHQALLAIKGSPDERLTVGGIAERLLLRHHSAVELVDRLAKMELVARTPDTQDRRRVQVTLTPLAEQRLEVLSHAHLEELRALGPLLRALLDRIGEEDGARGRGG